MFTTIKNLLRDESGVTAIEYGLIAALVAVAIVGGSTALFGSGGALDNAFNTIANTLSDNT